MILPKPITGKEVINKLKEIGLISKDCLVRDFCISGSFDDVVEIKVTETASDKNALTQKVKTDMPTTPESITKDK